AKGNIQGTYWNGKIYVPGGFAAGVHITENAIYDIASNAWSTGAPLPAAQTGTNVAFNNKIYNFGGNPGPQSTVTIYDIATNTWSNGAAMPVAITYGRATAAGGFGYYAGGITSVTVNTLYRYSFAGNTWTTMAPLQTARTSCELMTSPDSTKLFAVMGGDATFFTGVPLPVSVEIYDIAANSWTYGNPVVVKAAAPSGGLAQSKLMVQGGVDTTVYLDTVQVSVLQACPSPTPTASPSVSPTATATATPTGSPSCTPGQYTITGGTDTIVAGATDTGSDCDDCITTIALPFNFQLYGNTYSSVNLSSNGTAQFVTVDSTFVTVCIPWAAHDFAIHALFEDARTDAALSGCSTYPGGSCGIYTSVSGTSPNRIFNIEWRAVLFGNNASRENFELRLYENSAGTNKRFDVVYGEINGTG